MLLLLAELVGQGVHVGFRWHGLEERRVKHRNLRHVRHVALASTNALHRSAIVQRSQLGQLLDLGNHILVDNDGLIEVVAAMNDTMTHRVDLAKRGDNGLVARGQKLKNLMNCCDMVRKVHLHYLIILVHTVLDERSVGANTIANALGDDSTGLYMNQLKLKGR